MKKTLVIALIIPAFLVLVPMPILMRWGGSVSGWPISVLWLLLCIPLTTLCLFLAERTSR